MNTKHLTRRIAAATLAAALTLGGLLGVGAVASVDTSDATQEQAGAPWGLASHTGGKGGASTQGATWS